MKTYIRILITGIFILTGTLFWGYHDKNIHEPVSKKYKQQSEFHLILLSGEDLVVPYNIYNTIIPGEIFTGTTQRTKSFTELGYVAFSSVIVFSGYLIFFGTSGILLRRRKHKVQKHRYLTLLEVPAQNG